MQVIYKQDRKYHSVSFSHLIERLYRKLIKFLYNLVTLKTFLQIHRENIEIFKICRKSGLLSKDQARLKFWIYTFTSSVVSFAIIYTMKYFEINPIDYFTSLFLLATTGPILDMVFVWLRTCEDFRKDEEIKWAQKIERMRHF